MSSASRRRLGEFGLIEKLFAPLATSRGAAGLRDDVAVLNLRPGQELVLKTDAIVEDRHFLRSDPPKAVAQKALRVNLSDLAAKGAEPLGYLLMLAIPRRISDAWLTAFAAGLRSDQRTFSLSLLGGDTTRTDGPLTIAVTALGTVSKGKAIRRAGAKPGDLVFVTGTIGDAGLGLELLERGKRTPSAAIQKYRVPQPRLGFGKLLHGIATASIDISDGLLADLGHVAETSRVSVVIDAAKVPLSKAVQTVWGTNDNAVLRAASAGDDYEIAFTCRPRDIARVEAAAFKSKTKVTLIGQVRRGQGLSLIGRNGKSLRFARAGFTHF
jgi:thiamine-monophosphate kinase